MNTTISLRHMPFDGHVHFRREAMLRRVAPETAKQCWGALAMPNTAPHLLTPEDASLYRAEVLAAVRRFNPDFALLLAGYLTPDSDPDMIARGFESGAWQAMKVYPLAAHGHGTTNAESGINMWHLPEHPAIAMMERIGMPLLIHPEVNTYPDGSTVDIYDREKKCIPILEALVGRYPDLRLSCEHGTSKELAEFVRANGEDGGLVATVTAHHLLHDRNDLHQDGFQPHLMCYPIPKRREDRDAWRELVAEGHPFIFAGTDSAPHPTKAKEKACGCAGGVFTAPVMTELYAEAFADMGALAHLEDFLCVNGPRFYDLEPRGSGFTLKREDWNPDTGVLVTEEDAQVRTYGFFDDVDPSKSHTFRWIRT